MNEQELQSQIDELRGVPLSSLPDELAHRVSSLLQAAWVYRALASTTSSEAIDTLLQSAAWKDHRAPFNSLQSDLHRAWSLSSYGTLTVQCVECGPREVTLSGTLEGSVASDGWIDLGRAGRHPVQGTAPGRSGDFQIKIGPVSEARLASIVPGTKLDLEPPLLTPQELQTSDPFFRLRSSGADKTCSCPSPVLSVSRDHAPNPIVCGTCALTVRPQDIRGLDLPFAERLANFAEVCLATPEDERPLDSELEALERSIIERLQRHGDPIGGG